MQRWLACAAVALALSACAPAAQAPAPGPEPSASLVAAFPDCTWGEVRAAGVSIWSFDCANERLVGDEGLPGFFRERSDEAGGVVRWPVIWILSKAADAPLDAVLPAVRAASPAPDIESCSFEPIAELPQWFELVPTGEARARYDAFRRGEAEEPSMPCGELGPSEGGRRLFRVVPGADDKVVAVDTGSDIQVFDTTTIRASR